MDGAPEEGGPAGRGPEPGQGGVRTPQTGWTEEGQRRGQYWVELCLQSRFCPASAWFTATRVVQAPQGPSPPGLPSLSLSPYFRGLGQQVTHQDATEILRSSHRGHSSPPPSFTSRVSSKGPSLMQEPGAGSSGVLAGGVPVCVLLPRGSTKVMDFAVSLLTHGSGQACCLPAPIGPAQSGELLLFPSRICYCILSEILNRAGNTRSLVCHGTHQFTCHLY